MILAQADNILGEPVLVPEGEQTILFMACIFQIAAGVHGDERRSAAHSFQSRKGPGIENAGADKNIRTIVVIAELFIILRCEEAVFAAGLHLLQGIRGIEFIRRTDEVDVYTGKILFDDIQLLYQIILFAILRRSRSQPCAE